MPNFTGNKGSDAGNANRQPENYVELPKENEGGIQGPYWDNSYMDSWMANIPDHKSGNLLPSEQAYKKYTVVSGDSLETISSKFEVQLQDLLFANTLTLIDPKKGLVSDGKNQFYIYPELILFLPANAKIPEDYGKDEEQKAQEDQLNQALADTDKSDEPIKAVLKALLGFPLATLGAVENSKQKLGFQVEIPIAGVPVIRIMFGGEFEQERKATGTQLVQHSIKPKIGITINAGKWLSGEVALFGLFSITSDNLDQAVYLIYYGLYKLGRETADSFNDLGPALSSAGTSVALSVILFCGLNLLYGKDDEIKKELNVTRDEPDQGFIDKVMSAEKAESNVAAMEKDLFGYDKSRGDKPFDENNKNEVSYGGGIEAKVSAEAGENSAEAGVSLAQQSVINAQTLNETGISGEQPAGLWDDYKVGKLNETHLKIGGSFEVLGSKIGVEYTFVWGEYMSEISQRGVSGINRNVETLWGFKKFEVEYFGEIKLGSLSSTGTAFITELISNAVVAYEQKKDRAKENDPNANLAQLSSEDLIAKAKTNITTAMLSDLARSMSPDAAEALTQKVKISLKFIAEKDPKLGGVLKPSVLISIGQLNELKLDVGLFKFESSNYRAAANINIK